MGGRREPEGHPKLDLYKEYARLLALAEPKYFIVENVGGLAWLQKGRFLRQHIDVFKATGRGYVVTSKLLNAKDYGVPAERKRVFIVGVRRDLASYFWFPVATHGPDGGGHLPWVSHGDSLAGIAADSEGEYYDRPQQPFSWWYMSRNRKRPWDVPSYAVLGNWRHVPLHPASPTMRLVESNLKSGSKQRWEFTHEYDHLESHPERPHLENPRRLTWREGAAIQGLPPEFEPEGSVSSKYLQIGNAVPPLLMEALVSGLVTGENVRSVPPPAGRGIAASE